MGNTIKNITIIMLLVATCWLSLAVCAMEYNLFIRDVGKCTDTYGSHKSTALTACVNKLGGGDRHGISTNLYYGLKRAY